MLTVGLCEDLTYWEFANLPGERVGEGASGEKRAENKREKVIDLRGCEQEK